MNDKNNPLLNGGVPLNNNDLTKDVNNTKSNLLSSLQSLRRLQKIKQDLQDKQVNQKENNKSVKAAIKTELKKPEVSKPVEPANNKNVSAGITLSMLDEDNKDSLTVKKDEYLAYDYKTQPQPEEQPKSTQSFSQPEIQQNFEAFEQEEVAKTVNQPVELENQKPQQPAYIVKSEKKSKKEKKQPLYADSADIKKGKKIAWLAYILFFIPLLFAGKNSYVRFHANEALEINLFDILGVGLLLTGYYVKSTNDILTFALLLSLAFGIILLILTTLTKVMMIIFSFCGRQKQTPWLWKYQIIKP